MEKPKPRVRMTFAPPPTAFHQAVGEAVEAYARVEYHLVFLLQELLKLKPFAATAIFQAIQNARSRGKLFEDLLNRQFEGKVDAYWAHCNRFLGTLAKFRNALVHWQPNLLMFKNDLGATRYRHGLAPLVPTSTKPIEEPDIKLFIKDCHYIEVEIRELTEIVKRGPSSLPEIFQPPEVRPNLALLQPPPTPKAPQPQRPPSVPKLSPAQMRAKAEKDARTKKK